MGIEEKGQVCIMIHSGSRGLGHQVATDALVEMEKAMKRDKIHVNDRQVCIIIYSSVYSTSTYCSSIYPFIYPSIYSSSIQPSVSPCIHPFIHLSPHPSIHSFIHPFICPSIHPSCSLLALV